jgi:hypothetical protein
MATSNTCSLHLVSRFTQVSWRCLSNLAMAAERHWCCQDSNTHFVAGFAALLNVVRSPSCFLNGNLLSCLCCFHCSCFDSSFEEKLHLHLAAIKLFYFSINLLVKALGVLDYSFDCSFPDSFLVALVIHSVPGNLEFHSHS